MIRIFSILAAAVAGWIGATILIMMLDPALAARGIEPLQNHIFLDKETLGLHLSWADGAALMVGLLAAVVVGLKKPKGGRRRR